MDAFVNKISVSLVQHHATQMPVSSTLRSLFVDGEGGFALSK